ncbi:holo-ACP synthase [Kitasatospora sp. NPDC057223]|uniref:holo-ACP synthase n=1 Tax=Kitasatospora sp. NPDC057223 TaxID=3346055 RepID=UPI003627EC38
MRVGIDLLEIARFARIAAHPAGRRIVFSVTELAHADALGAVRRTEYLAGRFCAKEATAKALGRGLGQGLGWRDIEVLGDAHGAPQVRLGGGARKVAEQAGIGRIDLSLSHQGGLVVCVAIALPREGPQPQRIDADPPAARPAGAPS